MWRLHFICEGGCLSRHQILLALTIPDRPTQSSHIYVETLQSLTTYAFHNIFHVFAQTIFVEYPIVGFME